MPTFVTATPELLAFLQGVPIFGGLDDAELVRIVALAEEHAHPAGVDVVTEGDLAKDMFLVLEGQVQVTKAGRALRTLGSGDCFGEMALIDIQPRSASVRTVAPARLLVLGFDDLIRIYQFNMQTYTIVVLNIAREISRRLRMANELIAALGQPELP